MEQTRRRTATGLAGRRQAAKRAGMRSASDKGHSKLLS